MFGIAVVTVLFLTSGHLGAPSSFNAGVEPALVVAAGLSLLGTLAALAVGRSRRIGNVPAATTCPQGAEA